MPGKKSDAIKEADEQIKKILQTNIIKIRKMKGVTQVQLAEVLGISRETYSNYECRTLPPQYLIYRLAKIYNVSPDVFYRTNLDTNILFLRNENNLVYGESTFQDLTDREKLLLMKFRLLNSDDKNEVTTLIADKLDKQK